ncbi:hypothetical protein NOI87_24055, partial [Neorhizobium galegae]|uniref:hypothetical protein n=1 Tax=Neorhizobium galegae TaxID=399 RepID=UPI0021082BD5
QVPQPISSKFPEKLFKRLGADGVYRGRRRPIRNHAATTTHPHVDRYQLPGNFKGYPLGSNPAPFPG